MGLQNFEKYKFRKYNKNYPVLFRTEKYRLRKILPNDAKIEHIGSTSVPGLGGKGIIDIFISVKKKDWARSLYILQKKDYLFFPLGGSDERKFFQKDYKYREKTRRVHIHLTYHNSQEFKRSIAVINYLKNNKEAVKEYSEIKKKAVKVARGDGWKYRKYKQKFLDKIETKAIKNEIDKEVKQDLKGYKAGKYKKIKSLKDLD